MVQAMEPQECSEQCSFRSLAGSSQGSVPGEAPKGSPRLALLVSSPVKIAKKLALALPWALCPGMGLKECQDRPFLGSVPKKGHSSRSYASRFNLQQLQQQPIKATFAEQQLLLQNVHWECSSHDWQQLQATADGGRAAAEDRPSAFV